MGMGRTLERLVADAVRAEVGRTLDRAVEPLRAKVDEVITEAVRKAAAPLQEHVERVVGDAVESATEGLRKSIRTDKTKTMQSKRR